VLNTVYEALKACGSEVPTPPRVWSPTADLGTECLFCSHDLVTKPLTVQTRARRYVIPDRYLRGLICELVSEISIVFTSFLVSYVTACSQLEVSMRSLHNHYV
jgi:hypothetical protein